MHGYFLVCMCTCASVGVRILLTLRTGTGADVDAVEMAEMGSEHACKACGAQAACTG